MMQDCAMQILEIVMNSNHANSKFIEVHIVDSIKKNKLEFTIIDDGKGMDEETCKKVTDPFVTSRSSRKIGMGLPFMKGLTEQCNGSFEITSKLGSGTKVVASVQRDHWDTPTLGDLGEMMMFAIQANEVVDYLFTYQTDSQKFVFDSREVKQTIDGMSLLEPDILLWIKEYINQGIQLTKEKRV